MNVFLQCAPRHADKLVETTGACVGLAPDWDSSVHAKGECLGRAVDLDACQFSASKTASKFPTSDTAKISSIGGMSKLAMKLVVIPMEKK